MLFQRGQLLSRLPARPSFAGRNLMERMRSTAFALLGITAALALGLVALVSQQSLPFLPDGPIPAYQARQGSVANALALGARPTEAGPGTPGGASRSGSTPREPDAVEPREPGLSSSDASSQPTAPSASAPAQAPAGEPTPPAPHPAPAPVASAPTAPTSGPAAPAPSSSPSASSPSAPDPVAAPPSKPTAPQAPAVVSSSPGKGHAYGRQKAVPAPKEHAPPAPPHAPPPPAAAEPGPVAQPAPEAPPTVPAAAPGNGHGHAYGHEK
jgi:hypothetical protein